jgi:hypothetical protein
LSVSVHDLQAPKENGALLAHPPLREVGRLLEDNCRRLDAVNLDILGRPFHALRALARRQIVDAARQYLAAAGESVAVPDGSRLLLAGHQPELFHPGVWSKNFALNGLARRHNAIPLNLIVDNDTAKHTLLYMPAGDHVAQLPFDHWQSEVPYEERRVLDERLFHDLPQSAAPFVKDWRFPPILDQFWDLARRQAERTPLLGERLVAARRTLERRRGCANLEVPLSMVCQTEAFAWFGCHVLDNLPAFLEIYNGVVQAYRQRYHMRSRHHPVPDLARDGDWLEAPLWAWRTGQARRSRLFARRTGTGIELRAGSEPWPTLRLGARPDELVPQWQGLAAAGYKIRTRALTTTLFARLFVGDLFIHGLGGGKYDELTDEIMRRFYNLEPPAFLVLTGTLLLPLPRPGVTEDDRRRLHALDRDLWWNPQRHLQAASPEAQTLSEEKMRWIDRASGLYQNGRQRYEALRRLTGALRPYVRDQGEETRRDLEQATRQLRIDRISTRRDYAFCLYPEEELRAFCERLL